MGRGDPQRERQERAQLRHVRGGVRVGAHPIRAEHSGQHFQRLAGAQHAQRQQPRALPHSEPGQPVAAGDHGQAAGAARQQWTDLVGAARVVQHHEDPPVGEQAPVQRRGLVALRRDPLGRHSEGAQEAGQRPLGRQRGSGCVSGQVHVELAVGELASVAVRPLHRQRRLPHARHAGDHHDRAAWRLAGQQRVQFR